MSDKPKPSLFSAPKVNKRVSAVGSASTSRPRVLAPPSSTVKQRNPASRMKLDNKNMSGIGADIGDVTMMKEDASLPIMAAERLQLAYGRNLRAMLAECLLEEKIEREQTEIDIQMMQLTDRLKNVMDVLDKTSQRMKDVSFAVEQKRLLDLRSEEYNRFLETTDHSKLEMLQNIKEAELSCINKLETKNIDFGYDKESGHEQLLDAVNEAITSLEYVKKHSDLDTKKLDEYNKTQKALEDLESDKIDLDSLKAVIEKTFPKFSEKLLKDVADKVATVFDEEYDSDD